MRVLPLERCPVCGATGSTPVPLGDADVLERCSACGTVRAARYADPDEVFTEGYLAGAGGPFGIDLSHPRWHAYLLEVGDRRMRLVERISGLRAGALLDVGCGQGELLEAARARRWRVQGVEPLEDAARLGRERAGLDIVPALLEASGLPERSYDVVSAFHVAEHLTDVPAFLRTLARWVKPGGAVVIESPNFDSQLRAATGSAWMHLRPLEHLVHLSPRSLRTAFALAGLEPLAIRTPSHLSRQHTLGEALENLGRAGWRRGADPDARPSAPVRLGLRAVAAAQDRLGSGMVVLGVARVPRIVPPPMPTTPPPEIFKAYDIRGLYGEQIDGDVAEQVGRAFARVLAAGAGKPASELRIGLGRDMRLTAPELAGRYKAGMVAEGARVLDAGMVGTEQLYFLVGSRELDGGLMCTASHNPKAYTGAKLVKEGAIALSGDAGIGDVRREIEAGLGDAPGGGSSEDVDVTQEFQERALDFIDVEDIRPLKVVLDGGNGMAGPMVGPILERLPGLDLVPTYFTPDGNFPGHEPNPLLPENRQFIMDKVIEEGADLGIAWDGDADRCFFIDDKGQFVDGDFLTALLADSVLRKRPNSAILYDVRASRAVADTVEAAGGTAWMNRVGHAFFKTRMRDEGGVFGGEVSGHYYFADFYNADSGTVPALLILELLGQEGKTLSELLDRYRSKYFISGEINSEVSDADTKMAELEEAFSDARITHLDGVSVDYDDWHFNVRKSNTEPLLRLTLESLVSAEDMEAKRDHVLGLIRA